MKSEIVWVRIDTRIIHGQIVVKWSKKVGCKSVVVVDKNLAADPFMANFYKMSAPSGFDVTMVTAEKAKEMWDNDGFNTDKTMIICKDVKNLYDLWKTGFPLPLVDIGNQVSAPGKTQITTEVFLSKPEYDMLKEMSDAGIDVFMQIIPEYDRFDMNFIGSKF